jgi:hypothetical protein
MVISALFVLFVFDWLTSLVVNLPTVLDFLVARPTLLQVLVATGNPFLAVFAALVFVVVLALGWGYWLVPDPDPTTDVGRGWFRIGVAAAVGYVSWRIWLIQSPDVGGIRLVAPLALAVVAAVTLAVYAIQWAILLVRTLGEPALAARLDHLRADYTRLLGESLSLLVILLVCLAVEAIGATLVYGGQVRVSIPKLYGGAIAVVGVLRPALQWLAQRGGSGGRARIPLGTIAGIAALLLLIGILGALAAIPKLTVAWLIPGRGSSAVYVMMGLGVLSWFMGQMWIFVNRSSLYPTYAERIRRAYLGASNAARLDNDGPVPLADTHPGDGIDYGDYHPERFGGPVHLINTTLNETVDGRSQIEQRDRKGLGLTVGPGGISVGVSHHALWTGDRAGGFAIAKYLRSKLKAPEGAFRVFPAKADPEALDLGNWVAVSGAAFSTGLGARTSFGLSVLAGLANVRLGYWWRSGVHPAERAGVAPRRMPARIGGAIRALFPVQSALLDEWLARFPGVARPTWYLSDGGHFENTAAYELIRRKLPFIMVCDCGADPDYRFEDVGNLVLKARTDFGAEITFLDRQGLVTKGVSSDFKAIGTLDDLRRHAGPDKDGLWFARAHAALATIRYDDGSAGVLLLVKPTVDASAPADILNYQAANADFPQQSTLDQFFDEAQWESYRRLGESIAGDLLTDPTGSTWTLARSLA